jgi:hypothetical protein
LADIEHFHKKLRRQTKEERMADVEAGRVGRETFSRPKKRVSREAPGDECGWVQGAHVGRTNRELAKRKNYQMVKQKVRGKNRQRSFRDRQISLRKYLQQQKGIK